MNIKLVAKYLDGRLRKGYSDDFLLLREIFHMTEGSGRGKGEEIRLSDLKAVFFVEDFSGDPGYRENKTARRPAYHHRVSIRFRDGEELVGYTDDDLDRAEVIRLVPVDPMTNNTLIYVMKRNTVSVQSLNDKE